MIRPGKSVLAPRSVIASPGWAGKSDAGPTATISDPSTRTAPRVSGGDEIGLGIGTEQVEHSSGCYQALEVGGDLGGGIVECGTGRPLWLPYVEVSEIATATDRARRLGASVLLEPREGPAGWRSVISTPAAGEIALWQQKGRRR